MLKIRLISPLILLLSLSAFTQYSQQTDPAVDIPKAQAGLILSFKQDFIDEYRESYTEKYLDYLKNMTFPTIHSNFEVSVLNMSATFFNIKINESTFNANKSVIQMHEKQPNFEIRLVEVGINVNFNYTLISDPDLVNDTGSGNLLIQDLNLTLLASPQEEKNFYNFKLHEIEIQIDDFELNLRDGDLAQPIDYFSEALKQFIRHHLVGVVTNETTQSIQDYINGYLNDCPREYVFESIGLALDKRVIKDGVIVKDRYTSILLDGTLHSVNNTNDTKNYTTMPIHSPQSEDIQVFVSEYYLDQLLQAVVDMRLFKYSIGNQTSDNIDAIITEFEDSFGDHKNVSIFIQGATNSSVHTPKIEITPKSTVIEFGIEIHIKNPLDDTQDVAQIIAKMTCNMEFSIDEDLKLSGDVDQLHLDVIDFIPYYVTKTQAKDINSRLAILSPLLNSYINKALDDGLRIPIPKEIAQYIKKEKVTTHDGYLLIDGDVDFKTFEDIIIDNLNKTNSTNTDNTENSTITDNDNDNTTTPQQQDQPSNQQLKFKMYQQLRNLQDSSNTNTQTTTRTKGGKAHFSPSEKKEAQDRFYLLVEQVYQVNANNTNNSYAIKTPTDQDDLITQVQDLLKGNMSENVTQNWTDDMKQNSKIIQEDFKSGKLQFKDINLSKIAEISWNTIQSVAEKTFNGVKNIGNAVEGELKNDLNRLEDAGKKVGGWFGGLFGRP